MSWDVFIQHLPASALCVADIPDDFTPLPLGSRADVLNAILSVFPGTDTSDPTWLTFDGASYSIEFGVGSADLVTYIALHVRGDESAIPPIALLIEQLQARGLDSWTGEFFDPISACDSIRRWSEYVDGLTQ
ncbi:MAG TPA: hypothetical protein VGQ36_03505 [Thermoanaerobaculia bacterium]|jgi:hypothetical protein|nr:hypothetical protein [Thermoanaerobaculia bacterium]